jgi:hypothetical protein
MNSAALQTLGPERVLFGERLRRPYVARRDAVDTDPVSGQLDGQAAHETHDAGLGRRVLGVFVPPVSDAHDRRQGYYVSAPHLSHGGGRGAAYPHYTFEIYLVRMIPLLIGELRERHPVSDTRVGHHGVDRSVLILYRRHYRVGFLGVHDV